MRRGQAAVLSAEAMNVTATHDGRGVIEEVQDSRAPPARRAEGVVP